MHRAIFSVLVLITYFGAADLRAQSKGGFARNSVFAELGGNSGSYSLNYERFLTRHFSLRVGAGHFGKKILGGPESEIAVPVMINFFLGKRSSKLELGLGLLAGKTSSDIPEQDNRSFSHLTSFLGYRYQKPEGGLLLRGGIVQINVLEEYVGGPMKGSKIGLGISAGYAF